MIFNIKQEKFEGPMDLLLELIGKERLSVNEISLAKIADEYVNYVKLLEKIDPEALAEFLVVAAYLCLIKSRSLLPTIEISQEEEASIEELARRLEEYRKIKELSLKIKKIISQKKFVFSKEGFAGIEPIFYPPPGLTAEILKNAFQKFLDTLPKLEKLTEEKIRKIISLEDKIQEIQSIISKTISDTFSSIVKSSKEKIEVIVSFLAILELAKQKFIDLHQSNPFADIMIKKLDQNGH